MSLEDKKKGPQKDFNSKLICPGINFEDLEVSNGNNYNHNIISIGKKVLAGTLPFTENHIRDDIFTDNTFFQGLVNFKSSLQKLLTKHCQQTLRTGLTIGI